MKFYKLRQHAASLENFGGDFWVYRVYNSNEAWTRTTLHPYVLWNKLFPNNPLRKVDFIVMDKRGHVTACRLYSVDGGIVLEFEAVKHDPTYNAVGERQA